MMMVVVLLMTVMMMMMMMMMVVVVAVEMVMILLRTSHPTLSTTRAAATAAANTLPRDPPQVEVNGVQPGYYFELHFLVICSPSQSISRVDMLYLVYFVMKSFCSMYFMFILRDSLIFRC